MCTYFFAIKFVYSFNAILLTYVPKGVFAKRRYPRLWLTSKLDAHFAGYANPCAVRRSVRHWLSLRHKREKSTPIGVLFFYGGEKGIRTLDTG